MPNVRFEMPNVRFESQMYVLKCQMYVLKCQMYVLKCQMYVLKCQMYVLERETLYVLRPHAASLNANGNGGYWTAIYMEWQDCFDVASGI